MIVTQPGPFSDMLIHRCQLNSKLALFQFFYIDKNYIYTQREFLETVIVPLYKCAHETILFKCHQIVWGTTCEALVPCKNAFRLISVKLIITTWLTGWFVTQNHLRITNYMYWLHSVPFWSYLQHSTDATLNYIAFIVILVIFPTWLHTVH